MRGFVNSGVLLAGLVPLAAISAPTPVVAQTSLPSVVVPAPAAPAPTPPKRKRVAVRVEPAARPAVPAVRTSARQRGPFVAPANVTAAPVAPVDVQTPAQRQAASLDRTRDNLFTRTGVNVTDLSRAGMEALPQGANRPFESVAVTLPGVSVDTHGQGGFHIRNEHSNVQYRLNGIQLPEAGIAGFGQFLETSLVGNVALLTGALPAQYGLRTAGVLDITTRQGAFDGGGSVTLYGGSRGTLTPQFEYGGSADGWNYFVTGRYVTNRQGLENPASTFNPIHDFTRQGRYFAYVSKDIDATSKLSFISGGYSGRYQIPNNPGQTPSFTAFGITDFDSRRLDQNQYERTFYNVAAYQTSIGPLDLQFSGFSRISTVRYRPDVVGDILFNGNATDVFRSSIVNGVQADAAYRWNPMHTTRFGMQAQMEKSRVVNGAIVLPTDGNGDPVDAPFGIVDRRSKTGYTLSGYVQHEWKLLPTLAVNAGVRFDQNWAFVDSGQVSPRVGVTWTPWWGASFHAGYARYFTPPQQTPATPANFTAFNGTTLQAETQFGNPVRPERSHYVDFGVDQAITDTFKVGVAFYYKRARNLLDAGQFGPALTLNTFNYDRAYNSGVELKAIYEDEYLRAYANVALARQRVTKIISNEYLFGVDELDYISRNYIYTDHAQRVTASAGANLRIFDKTRVGFDVLYQNGLRAGDFNRGKVPSYVVANFGATHDFRIPGLAKDSTLRLDVLNVADRKYIIRDGSGIGVFAPQYGQRRGFYAGITQRF